MALGSTKQELTHEEIAFKYRLLRGFCYQMELLGIWEYAVYAILVASPSTNTTLNPLLIYCLGVITEQNKWIYIRHIVQRNYKEAEILSPDSKAKVKLPNLVKTE